MVKTSMVILGGEGMRRAVDTEKQRDGETEDKGDQRKPQGGTSLCHLRTCSPLGSLLIDLMEKCFRLP